MVLFPPTRRARRELCMTNTVPCVSLLFELVPLDTDNCHRYEPPAANVSAGMRRFDPDEISVESENPEIRLQLKRNVPISL
mmetsp:Transcript_56960/g.119078  ORF Transcript_56960/g.119078 Transcript_56960/m.119078 type:complete len:81 (+) Transcript_56960:113-355(+)